MSEQALEKADISGVAASGEALRQARLARGLTVGDIAQILKLAPRQVEAIEAEAFDQLPGAAFARGFIRNYARYLGLNPAPLLERLGGGEAAPAPRLALESNAEGSMPLPAGYGSTSLTPALLVLVVLALLVFAFWRFNLLNSLSTHRNAPAVVSAQQSSLPGASEPLFPPHTDETAVVTAQAEPAASNVVETVSPGASAGSVVPTLAASAVAQSAPVVTPAVPASVPAPAAKPVAVAASAPAASMPTATATATGPQLQLIFEEDAWVEIRDAAGHSLMSRLAKAGEKQVLQGKAPFALVLGNAPHVKLHYQGQAVELASHTKSNVARLTLK